MVRLGFVYVEVQSLNLDHVLFIYALLNQIYYIYIFHVVCNLQYDTGSIPQIARSVLLYSPSGPPSTFVCILFLL